MTHDLEDAILARRSSRMFLRDKQVPKQLVTEALELAIHAPSNSNVQPWHVVFASGRARDRLVEALLVDARSSAPKVPPLPDAFAHARSDLGAAVYGSMGIARHDSEARRIAVLRNWEFFRAPLAAVVCMHRDLDYVDAIGVGLFLQTLLLGLTARGLGTCVQVSIAGYPRDDPRTAGHRRGDAHSVRPCRRLPRPRLSWQFAACAAESPGGQRRVRRELNGQRDAGHG
jgi:nitroreductase